ncbi:MAG: sulfoxide reductase heme-binding subunit YedZ [Pseudomonadales bacterium]|nr:sulfoxide reductase heme-binding subunit YedZ [Pseudomonadales bacterium]
MVPKTRLGIAKVVVFCLLALPLVLLGVDVWREVQLPGSAFGPDPTEEVLHYLGQWGLRILLLTLAVSPASRLLRKPRFVRFRRMMGLWAFSYIVLHFAAYLLSNAGNSFEVILASTIHKVSFAVVGFYALLMLVPLAVTSTRGWQRRLGPGWRKLHRLVYPAALAAWIHLLWLSKGDFMDPLIYGLVLVLLFGERIVFRIRKERRATAANAV